MHSEETSFVYVASRLPDEIMDHEEYVKRRDEAVRMMIGERLCVKGELMIKQEVDERMLGAGIPEHQRAEVMRRQFERAAVEKFSGQYDAACMSCSHHHMETYIEISHVTHGYILRGCVKCAAVKNSGATCFDGYSPVSRKWLWIEEAQEAVGVRFKMEEQNKKGEQLVTMIIDHDHQKLDLSDPITAFKRYGESMHDEPPGIMTRNNADSGYLTSKELKMANEALKVTSKIVRATLPTPKPQTPMEDAW